MDFRSNGSIKRNSKLRIKLCSLKKNQILGTIGDNILQLTYLENLIYKNDNIEIDVKEIENTVYGLEYLLFKLKSQVRSNRENKGDKSNEWQYEW